MLTNIRSNIIYLLWTTIRVIVTSLYVWIIMFLNSILIKTSTQKISQHCESHTHPQFFNYVIVKFLQDKCNWWKLLCPGLISNPQLYISTVISIYWSTLTSQWKIYKNITSFWGLYSLYQNPLLSPSRSWRTRIWYS